jgi:hypothetical protein
VIRRPEVNKYMEGGDPAQRMQNEFIETLDFLFGVALDEIPFVAWVAVSENFEFPEKSVRLISRSLATPPQP